MVFTITNFAPTTEGERCHALVSEEDDQIRVSGRNSEGQSRAVRKERDLFAPF